MLPPGMSGWYCPCHLVPVCTMGQGLHTTLPCFLLHLWGSLLTGLSLLPAYSLQGSGPDPEMVPALHGPPGDEAAMYLEHLPVYRVCWTARPGQGSWECPQEGGTACQPWWLAWCLKVQLIWTTPGFSFPGILKLALSGFSTAP